MSNVALEIRLEFNKTTANVKYISGINVSNDGGLLMVLVSDVAADIVFFYA